MKRIVASDIKKDVNTFIYYNNVGHTIDFFSSEISNSNIENLNFNNQVDVPIMKGLVNYFFQKSSEKNYIFHLATLIGNTLNNLKLDYSKNDKDRDLNYHLLFFIVRVDFQWTLCSFDEIHSICYILIRKNDYNDHENLRMAKRILKKFGLDSNSYKYNEVCSNFEGDGGIEILAFFQNLILKNEENPKNYKIQILDLIYTLLYFTYKRKIEAMSSERRKKKRMLNNQNEHIHSFNLNYKLNDEPKKFYIKNKRPKPPKNNKSNTVQDTNIVEISKNALVEYLNDVKSELLDEFSLKKEDPERRGIKKSALKDLLRKVQKNMETDFDQNKFALPPIGNPYYANYNSGFY